ncbi:DUF7520 family protein [Halalkalicoccus subterraneus]|uniref:DUF7520 family protein n=1 Tax=Halalkalicoccus subterraneus TaxID=2675002 RepID=UPI0013CEF2E9|nr:hypothetical protein [Halalkalicoccus subterraneus]
MNESAATTTRSVSGQQLVIGLYVGLVAFAGCMGFILGAIVEDLRSVAILGLISVPPTPAGMALYGSVTIAALLGVLLLAVRYVAPER